MAEDLRILGTDFDNVTGIIVSDQNGNEQSYGPAIVIHNQDKSVDPTESSQVVTADAGYSGLGSVTVGAISSSYIGSGVPRKSSSDLTASGATVTVPSGYYSSQASKSVASGTAGNPIATKSSATGNRILVTPSVTNTAGYISGGTKNGTAVSVSASELVSGTKSITSNGTGIDVTNYAAVDVDVPTGGATLQAKTNISPTTSSQTITPDSGYDGLSSVQINAMPSGSSVPPSTISGTSATISQDTSTTLTFTKTVSVTPVVDAGYISQGTAGNVSVSLTASVGAKPARIIHPSHNLQTVQGNTYVDSEGMQFYAVTTTNLTAENIKSGVTVQIGDSSDADRIASVTGTYSGEGGGGGASVDTKTITNSSNTATSLAFTNMQGEPIAWYLRCTTSISSSGSSSYYYIVSARHNGTNTQGSYFRIGSTRQVAAISSGLSYSYSGTTLTINSNGSRTSSPGSFYNGSYELVYIY